MSFNENDVDAEWESFISYKCNDDVSSDDEDELHEFQHYNPNEVLSTNIKKDFDLEAPKPSNIYISTKTKIAYLNTEINLKNVFWEIPVISYYNPCNGVVKKQMKFNSLSIEELEFIQHKLTEVAYFDEHIITNINNPAGRIKFKDIRKVSIGISKKDLLSYRCKKKSAFYNCFVLILRLKVEDVFKEFHIKVFNTGKLEIPGIQSETTFQIILGIILDILQPHVENKLAFKENTEETVLINSNFNCGFFIDREILNHILKNKYNIQCIYDPCSYPGIQCKFYYDESIPIENGDIMNGYIIPPENKIKSEHIKDVSFMIFRTGSVLIVGKCDEKLLFIIYEFLKNIFIQEYQVIRQNNTLTDNPNVIKDKKKKIRKKNITITI